MAQSHKVLTAETHRSHNADAHLAPTIRLPSATLMLPHIIQFIHPQLQASQALPFRQTMLIFEADQEAKYPSEEHHQCSPELGLVL